MLLSEQIWAPRAQEGLTQKGNLMLAFSLTKRRSASGTTEWGELSDKNSTLADCILRKHRNRLRRSNQCLEVVRPWRKEMMSQSGNDRAQVGYPETLPVGFKLTVDYHQCRDEEAEMDVQKLPIFRCRNIGRANGILCRLGRMCSGSLRKNYWSFS